MNMFCYQCQETAKNQGCTIRGVCGKQMDTANLQDLLIFILQGISLFGSCLKDEYDIRKRGIKDFRMNDSKKAKDIQKASPRGKLQEGLRRLRLMNQKPSDTFEFNYRSTLRSIFTPTSAEGATLESLGYTLKIT